MRSNGVYFEIVELWHRCRGIALLFKACMHVTIIDAKNLNYNSLKY